MFVSNIHDIILASIHKNARKENHDLSGIALLRGVIRNACNRRLTGDNGTKIVRLVFTVPLHSAGHRYASKRL